RPPPISTLFPYTTLFRSQVEYRCNPVRRLGIELAYFAFAINHEAYGNRLYSSCRETGLYLLPEYWRKFIAYEAVKHAPCLLGIHKVDIDASAVFKRVQD